MNSIPENSVYIVEKKSDRERIRYSSNPILEKALSFNEDSKSYVIKKIHVDDKKYYHKYYPSNEEGLKKAREYCKKNIELNKNYILENEETKIQRLIKKIKNFLNKDENGRLRNNDNIKKSMEYKARNTDPEEESNRVQIDDSPYKRRINKNRISFYEGKKHHQESYEEIDKAVAGIYYIITNEKNGYRVEEKIGDFNYAMYKHKCENSSTKKEEMPFRTEKEAKLALYSLREDMLITLKEKIDNFNNKFSKKNNEIDKQNIRDVEIEAFILEDENNNLINHNIQSIVNETEKIEAIKIPKRIASVNKNSTIYCERNSKIYECEANIVGFSKENDGVIYQLNNKESHDFIGYMELKEVNGEMQGEMLFEDKTNNKTKIYIVEKQQNHYIPEQNNIKYTSKNEIEIRQNKNREKYMSFS